jgi:hypothetical protein
MKGLDRRMSSRNFMYSKSKFCFVCVCYVARVVDGVEFCSTNAGCMLRITGISSDTQPEKLRKIFGSKVNFALYFYI